MIQKLASTKRFIIMIEARFNAWMQTHPALENHLIPETPDWSRLICEWNERQTHAPVRHFYVTVINRRNGAIYLDCTPRKIAFKCLGLTILYPTLLAVRMIYLICLPISLSIDSGLIICEGIDEERSAQEICQRVAQRIYQNLMDCLRIPFYAAALSLTCLTSCCLILIKPHLAYDLRTLIGDIEKSYCWGNSKDVSAPCFQPVSYLDGEREQREHPDTVYGNDAVLIAMSNFARSKIKFWREKRNLCTNGCTLPNADAVYVTPGYAHLLG